MSALSDTMQGKLQQLEQTLLQTQAMMTDLAAGRWQLAAESVLREGKHHVKNMQQMSDSFIKVAYQSGQQHAELCQQALQKLNTLIAEINTTHIEETSKKSILQIEKTSQDNLRKIDRSLLGFAWVNFLAVFIVGMIITMFTGFYLNSEWPWENHRRALKEREIGKAMVKAWPHLDDSAKTYIKNHILVNKEI